MIDSQGVRLKIENDFSFPIKTVAVKRRFKRRRFKRKVALRDYFWAYRPFLIFSKSHYL